MNPDPDLIRIPMLARMLGVSRRVCEDAVMAAGLDPITGVHRTRVEQVRDVITQWIREGRNL
jgi:hypothetical protein